MEIVRAAALLMLVSGCFDYEALSQGTLAPSGGVVIPKSGLPYSGPHTDLVLDICPDVAMEPNDAPGPDGHAVPLDFLVPDDTVPHKVDNLYICPMGANPATGRHDEDWFAVENHGVSVDLVAQIFYDISYGDLDVGITDSQGNLLFHDGSSVNNGCVAATLGDGTYYIVVTGSNDVEINRYQLLARLFTTPHGCM